MKRFLIVFIVISSLALMASCIPGWLPNLFSYEVQLASEITTLGDAILTKSRGLAAPTYLNFQSDVTFDATGDTFYGSIDLIEDSSKGDVTGDCFFEGNFIKNSDTTYDKNYILTFDVSFDNYGVGITGSVLDSGKLSYVVKYIFIDDSSVDGPHNISTIITVEGIDIIISGEVTASGGVSALWINNTEKYDYWMGLTTITRTGEIGGSDIAMKTEY